MAALLGDLYSMSNGAKQNNVPRLNNILLNKEKEETENTKENYLDDDISQQYSTTEQKPQVTFKQGKQVIKADGIATLEPFDAFSQEIENATNLMRSWRGDGYTPTPSEVQAIRVIASTSSNPKDDVARFVTAAAIHDRIPSITLENAYNNIDSISQYYVGKDYTAFDTSLLEKIDAGFKYYDIMQDMAKWAELDQRNDPKATELEAQIQEKLVALGDMKSAIPTSLFDSISNAVAENFAYMAVPAVKSAFSTALTKTALTKIVSVANIIPSPTIKAAIASMSVGAGILTQYNELSTLQAAQSYWDYMHDYEGQAEANKATAAIFSSLNGIFVGLTETFLDGVTSRAAGKLISKTAGKTVDQLGVNMLINLDSSGSIGRLGRSIYDWATGAIDEGFVNELPQTLFDELMTAAYKSSIDIPVDFNPGETFKEALNSAATGIVVGAVYGSLGIHSSMVNDRNTAIKLRNTAVKSNNYQEYIYQSADYKPEGVSDEVFDEARKRVWEKWENDKYELLKGTVYESETIAQEELYSTTTEEGEELAPLPSGEVYRTTDNKLYKETIEDKDGSYVVYFGNKESRAVYGNVAIDTDGDTLTVKSVRVRNGYENIRSEMVLDAISDTRTSETNIEWNTTTPALTAIKEDIINSNPNGKEAGLNYSTIPNSKLKTLESEIQKAFPSLNSQEVKVSAVLYSIADKDNAISDINKGKAFAPTSEIPGDIKAPLGIRGAANKAQALIYTAQNSDASTFTHELFHVVSSLRPDDSAALSSAIRTVLDNEDERQQLAQFIDNNIQIWGAGVSSEEILSSLDSLTGDEKTWSIPIEEHLARLYEAYRASQSSINYNLPTGIKNILIKLADAIKKVYRALRDNVPINSNIASAFDKMMGLDNATSTNGISNITKINEDSLGYDDVLFQEVVDKELLSKLETEETIKAYRAMQLVDGKLYPPMAAIVDGKRVQAAEFGKWYVADENPNLASPDIDKKTGKQKVDSQGNLKYKFTLDKGGIDKETGKTLTKIPAAYNPYWHASLSPLNDQFTTAYKRDNLVTVEVEIPKSELTSGYRAERAKDAVGLVDWKSGPVSSQLAKIGNPRQVILSRYNKVVRIIPDSEVAAKIADMLKDTDIGIPANTVTPSLAKELLNLGVNVFLEDYTAKFYGKDYINNLLNSLEKIDNKESAKKALLSDAVVYQGPVTDYSNSTLDAPVFDAYIEQGVADAIEYEKLLENTAMIEQEVDDYGTRSREEADPFYVPADFKPADNRQDIKGNIIDNSYDWTYEEFVNANAPEVYYAGTELEKDNQFIEALNNEETLRRYLAIIGEIIHHNTTAVNAGYQTEYNKTYHHEEKVQIIVPFKDQYYRDGLSERMLKQITNLDVRKASEYALNGKEWPKTTGLREAVVKELTDNARYYRNILAILTRDKQMLPSTLIETETELAIPERDKLDYMSINELSELAKKIKREDIAAQIEAGKLKVKGDVDEAYLAEISSVIKDQKEQIKKNEDNIKGLESSNKELSSSLTKIQQTLDEREKLIVSSQKILDNINSAITNDISSGRKDIDKQYADLMAEYNNLTDEEYYQKRATAKGSREKGKAEGARLGTMDYMSDMKRMFPYLFEKDGKSLYWTAGKSTNDNKQIRENINNRIEQIKQELTGLKIDMANYSIRSLMLNSSKLDEMLAMTKNNVNGLTKILTTEEVNNWNSKLNELSEKNKELKKELNAAKLSKNRKDNKIDALKEQLEKSKEDQSLLAKWIAAREKNNQAKLEKKIVDEQREIYAERISKLKEKSDLEIKSIKATIAEKQAQKKALDLIKRTKQKLANEIMKPVNLKVVDYDTAAEAILAIQALIDPNFRREWIYDLKTDVEQQSGGQTMTIQQAKDYFNSLDDAQRIDLSQYLSQDLIDRLTEQKRPLNDWTIDELMTLARQVNDLKNRGREVLSAKKDLEKARTRQIQKAIINALKHQGFNKKDKDNNSNIPGSLDSSRRERSFRAKYYNARFTTLRMQEIAQLLDGGYGNKGLAYKLLVDDKRYHQNMRDRKIEERFSALDELFTDKAIDAMAEKVTVDLGDGLIKDFTVDQLAYAYLSQRDESTKDAVRYGALLSPEEKGTSIEKSIDIETGEAINQFLMNDQVIADDNELIQVANQRYNKLLEAAEKELADRGLMELVEAISNDFNNPNNALRLNRACIEAYNTPLDMREYYLAIRRVDSNGKELNDSFVANFFDPVTNSIPVNPEQGFRIKRLNISPRHQTNIDMSLINVWSNAVRTQEHLIEHAAYIKQLHNVFNFYGSKEVVSAMDNAFGTALRREIAEYIDIVSNPYKGNKIEGKDKLIRTLRGNIGSAYLGWKMSGIVLQAITSPFPGLSELNPAELIGAYMQIARHPIEAIKMINDKSIMMKNRTMNMIIDESLQRRSKWDRNKAQKAFDKFEEVGQLGLTLVDRYAVAGSWLGMYYKTLNANIAAGMSSDVAEQSAIKTADDFILRTQPVGDKTELASMFRGNNEAMKALLQFQTSLNVIWNNLTADTLGFVHNGEYSKLIGTISGYILAGTILGMVSDGFSDEDNRWWKKLIYWAMSQELSSMPVFGSAIDNIAEKLITGNASYTTQGVSIFPAVDKVFQSISAISKGDWQKALQRATEGAEIFTGLPYSGIKEIKEVFNQKSLAPLLGRR